MRALPMRLAGALAVPRLRVPSPRVPGFRALGWFWAAVVGAAVLGAAVLQILGPPRPGHEAPPADPAAASRAPAGAEHAVTAPVVTAPAVAKLDSAPPHQPAEPGPASARPGRSNPGPIAPPDPALLEPSKTYPGASLPRIAADGRRPSQVYARAFNRNDGRPRIAVVLAGVGLNAADSEDAIRILPGEVTLAFSPYAGRFDRLVDAARSTGHEFLVSLPMEPQGYPLNDAGDHALLTGASAEQNRDRLEWALSRLAGYAGVTSALGNLRGERFAQASAPMASVLEELRERGLFFVDAEPGVPAPPTVAARGTDLVIDEPASRTEIDTKLAAVEQIARDKGSAVGLIGAVRPVTLERVAAWSKALGEKGLALAPISALTKDAAPPAAATARPGAKAE